jgi:hypothetical protein
VKTQITNFKCSSADLSGSHQRFRAVANNARRMASSLDDAVQWDVQHQCFTALHEGSLTSSIQAACWCPTMDLIAVVTVDTQLSVHRMNWQRLWSVSLEAPVTALCWRPDGMFLLCLQLSSVLPAMQPQKRAVVPISNIYAVVSQSIQLH